MKPRLVRLAHVVLGHAERESMLVVVLGAYTCGLVARLPDQLHQDGWLTLVSGRLVAHAGLPSTDSLTAWTAGAKWILTPNARLVLNYIHTSFDTPVKINGQASDDENALTMRAQYDF